MGEYINNFDTDLPEIGWRKAVDQVAFIVTEICVLCKLQLSDKPISHDFLHLRANRRLIQISCNSTISFPFC